MNLEGSPMFAGNHDGMSIRCTLCRGNWRWNPRKNDGTWEHDCGSCKAWAKWFYKPAKSASLFDSPVSVEPK
jgi:hypothetical protein